jgi:uncharacterized protein YbdZ (MbtH family)
MTDKRFFVVNDQNRQHVARQIAALPVGWKIEAKPKGRSLDQNAAQWPILEAFSQQLQWPVNGVMCNLTPDEFKDVLTAAFRNETQPRLASGLNGGVVMLGSRTSKMSKQEFSDWLEFLHAAAAIKGVRLDRAA